MVKLNYSLDYMGQKDAFAAGDMPPAVSIYFKIPTLGPIVYFIIQVGV